MSNENKNRQKQSGVGKVERNLTRTRVEAISDALSVVKMRVIRTGGIWNQLILWCPICVPRQLFCICGATMFFP